MRGKFISGTALLIAGVVIVKLMEAAGDHRRALHQSTAVLHVVETGAVFIFIVGGFVLIIVAAAEWANRRARNRSER